MPEYVYALHDFQPENEDEVSFHAGERIEVIEKDDLYNDGWWQGRNLTGRVGLFPQSYTTPAPPSTDPPVPTTSTSSITSDSTATELGTKSLLQPLREESETESALNSTTNIVSPIPKTPAILHNDDDATDPEDHIRERVISTGGDGEVMKATMTDVQKAIEQLGRRGTGEDGDGARSFSFASSRDNTEGDTDTDFDLSDVDGADADEGGEGWHKGARRKLAAKARRAVEEAEKLEAMMGGLGISVNDRRTVAPPIEVELSDESEGEDGDFTMHSSIYPREHPHIPEEDEDVDTDPERLTPGQHTQTPSDANTAKRVSSDSHHVIVPDRDDSEQQTATATRTSFPAFHLPPAFPYADVSAVQTPDEGKTSKHSSHSVMVPPVITSTPPPAAAPTATAIIFPEPKRNSTPMRESMVALPSPTGSFPGVNPGGFASNGHSKHNSIASATSTKGPTLSISQPPLTASSAQETLIEEKKEKEKSHPTEWSVEDVIDWLKTKGFDQDVCDKFTEQEITGDVLLELDVNLLKTEIGIMAFGKRVRIANAITELRRPPSVVYSDHQEQLSPSSPGMQAHSPLSPLSQTQSQTHSRNQSLSHSHHSYTGNGYSYPQSVQSSLGSPMVYGNGNGIAYTTSQATEVPSLGGPATLRPEVETVNGDHPSGLPIGAAPPDLNGKAQKARPAQLALSPSDGALKSSALAVSDIPEETDEDRGHVSDGEIRPTTSMRRRLFGRSQESASSKIDSATNSRHSREDSVNQSPTVQDIPEKSKTREKEKDKDSASTGSRHTRSKKSIDGGKGGGDRLSIFGNAFVGGAIGKARKPAPRYSSTNEDTLSEKPSMFTLPRLHSSSIRKSSSTTSHRPSTPHSPDANGTKEKEKKKETKPVPTAPVREIKEKEGRDPALLRKRTSSTPNMPPSDLSKINGAVVSPLKQGQSILEQIGEHDHNGWMRKKGDRYNSWKLRYFVLKGPDLYCLKSSSKNETKIKGYINIVGYKVTVDENVNPGRYGFRIEHDHDKTHYFSSDEKMIVRDWMKAIMKATIKQDYTKPVISSCNIPTIPLTVAQAMNPAPRPPSPTARDATQKALRRENPNQLSSRDARILMGLSSNADGKEERTRLDSFFSNEAVGNDQSGGPQKSSVPPRPSREMRRLSMRRASNPAEESLIEWANTHLPEALQIADPNGPLCGGLGLLRLAESIKGRPSSPPVPDSAFPVDASDDKLDGLFRLFDFLLDNDVKMGSVSINDVRQGKRDKILQLIRALKAWEDKRRAIAASVGASSVQAGAFMAPSGMAVAW